MTLRISLISKLTIGTGLGLSVSFGIIERHGGKIEEQSKVNEGTTFTIKLPLTLQGRENVAACSQET